MAGSDQTPDIYDPVYVRKLFDGMAATYERVNLITSFGFSARWRRQCVDGLRLREGMTVVDWMTGMGEGWPHILGRIGPHGRLIAMDLSPGMLAHARARRNRSTHADIDVREGDVLESGIADSSADAIVSLFGVKTLSESQVARLASEIARVLRPGGRFALIEVSVPPNPVLRIAYLFYLRRVIPVLGAVLLGNPQDYRMLGIYTERFGDCRPLARCLVTAGLSVEPASYFFGCASGVRGSRPTDDSLP